MLDGGTTVIDLALEQSAMADALILVTNAPSRFEFSDDEALQNEDEASKLQQEHEAAIQRGDLARAAEIEAHYWMIGPQLTTDQVDSTLRIRLCEMNQIALANKVAGLGREQPLPAWACTVFGRQDSRQEAIQALLVERIDRIMNALTRTAYIPGNFFWALPSIEGKPYLTPVQEKGIW